nr:HTH domain-containing protein [Actinomadura litoris]
MKKLTRSSSGSRNGSARLPPRHRGRLGGELADVSGQVAVRPVHIVGGPGRARRESGPVRGARDGKHVPICRPRAHPPRSAPVRRHPDDRRPPRRRGRTVRRYVDQLLDLGVPVEAVRGRYGGYRLARGRARRRRRRSGGCSLSPLPAGSTPSWSRSRFTRPSGGPAACIRALGRHLPSVST